MGAIVSALAGVEAGVQVILQPAVHFAQACKRAKKSPGLPVGNPTIPYWTRDPPHPELVKIQSDTLPGHVDVAIIGSGITGAAVAYSLLEDPVNKGNFGSVAVFEARDISSGATARNGGQIKSSPYSVYTRFARDFDGERAAALTRFQRSHLDVLIGFCKAAGIEAQARETETIDIFLDDADFEDAVRSVKVTEEKLPEEKMTIWPREEARKVDDPEHSLSHPYASEVRQLTLCQKFGLGPSIAGVVSYKAGAVWPYRLVTGVWYHLLSRHDALSIETNTPVEAITADSQQAPEGYPYALQTPRGTVYARNIVHATNAHASHLVPGLRAKITPSRAHMSAQKPGDLFPEDYGSHRSASVIYGTGFDYISQLPPESPDVPPHMGDLMLGGGFWRSSKRSVDQLAMSDDAAPLDGLTMAHIAGIFPAVFSPNWGLNGGVKEAWSGLLGITGDAMPLVGKLDPSITGRQVEEATAVRGTGKPCGEWVAAGFSGEGMVWSWLSSAALGVMMSGKELQNLEASISRPGGKLDEWFPRELRISEQRLKDADLSNAPTHL